MSARPYNQQLTALEPRAAPLNYPAHQKSRGEGIVIDHRFFPHIIDLIWSFMPYPSLVVATMVCKTWREDSIKRLFEHVTVRECDGDDNDIVIRSRNTLWPQYSAVLIKTGKDDVDDLEDIVTLTEVVDLLHNPNNPLFKRSKPCYLFEMLDEQSKTIRLQTPPAVEMFRVRHVTAPTFICFLDYSVQFCLTRASVVCATSDLTLSLDCYDDPTAPIVPTAANQTPWYLHLCTGMEHLDSFTIVLIDKTKHDPPRPTVTPLAPHIPDAGEIASNFLNRAPPTLGIVYEVLRLACNSAPGLYGL